MPEQTPYTEFEFRQLAAICLKHWRIVVGCLLFGLLSALLICTCLITPLYRANVSLYVSTGGGEQQLLTAADLTAACLLADTCIGLLDSDTVLEDIAAQAGVSASAEELRNWISGEQVGDTPLLRVSVRHSQPETAARLAEAAAAVLPGTVQTLEPGCLLQVVDHARVPTERDSPDIPKACALGAAAGAALAVAGFAVFLLTGGRTRKETACER